MKKVLSFLVFGCLTICVYSQGLSVDDFIELSSCAPKKLESLISKKGFIPSNRALDEGNITEVWMQASKTTDSSLFPTVRQISKHQEGNEILFCFQTTSKTEHDVAVSRLKTEGFYYGNSKFNKDSSAVLFQRRNITVKAYSYLEEDVTYYCLLFNNKPVASARSIVYADDLLQFTSHEYLVTTFGEKNVKKDRYHFDENEINNCSVLFPNTPRQAVFIWQDQQNYTGLNQLVISGNLPTDGAIGFHQQIGENSWMLTDGIHFNMKLEELIRANGEDVYFYGRNTDYNLMVVPQKKGQIDFTTTGIILDCINCDGNSLLDQKVISSSEAIDNSLRLHIGLIILVPSSNHDSRKYASR